MFLKNQDLLKSKKYILLGFVSLLILFLALCISSLFFPLRESLTYDEWYHYESAKALSRGEAALRGDPEVRLRNILPMSLFNLLFIRGIQNFIPLPQSLLLDEIFLGKMGTIILATILAIHVFIWSRELYGIAAAFLALTLYVLDPTILAHSRLFTQDIPGACFVFIATYYFWKLLRFGGRKNVILSVISFSIAQISRYTSVHLVPIFIILSVLYYAPSFFNTLKNKDFGVIRRGIKQVISYIIVLLITVIVVLNIGYSFERSFTKFGDYKFASQTFTSLQENSIIKQIPIPIPYAYLAGLDFGKYKRETGFDSGIPYLLGRLSFEADSVKGFQIKPAPEYFLVAFFYKVPIATQILIVLALVSLFVNRKNLDFWRNEAFLLIPSGFYFIFMSFNTAQLGIRYILMIFPFLFVFASRVVTSWNARKIRYRIFITSLVIYLLISNLSYFPHYLSYFNELTLDRKMSYRILGDSNLDWGQSKNYLARYLDRHPNAMFLRYDGDGKLQVTVRNQPVDPRQLEIGKKIDRLVVESNQLTGITTDENRFYWLRSNREPIDHVAYSYLVFSIDEKDIKELIK